MSTDGLSPKAIAATIAAIVAPPLADLLGVDALWLGGLITAVLVAVVAWAAPPGRAVEQPLPAAPDLDDPEHDPTDVPDPSTVHRAGHTHLGGSDV